MLRVGIRMKIPPFEPARRYESDGGIFIEIQSLDAELFDEMSKIGILSFHDTAPFKILSNNSASRGGRRMEIPPFKLARQDESDGSILILLRILDAELFDKMSSGTVPKVIKMNDLLNILAFRTRKRMRIPPFDSSRRAGSNGSIFILL